MITYLKLFLIVIYTIICSIFGILFAVFDRSNFLYFKLSKVFSGGILFISGVKLEITGLENFDHKKTYVFVSNHSSQFDISALQYGIPNNMGIVFKKELAKIPLFGWQLWLGPYIMIDRKNPEKALRSIEEAKMKMTNKGISTAIFAEGTRSKTGEVQPFKRGAFHLAAKVGFPIVPISISGTEKILPKGKLKINSGTIHMRFAEPISTENILTRKDEIELMETVRQIIIENRLKD